MYIILKRKQIVTLAACLAVLGLLLFAGNHFMSAYSAASAAAGSRKGPARRPALAKASDSITLRQTHQSRSNSRSPARWMSPAPTVMSRSPGRASWERRPVTSSRVGQYYAPGMRSARSLDETPKVSVSRAAKISAKSTLSGSLSTSTKSLKSSLVRE